MPSAGVAAVGVGFSTIFALMDSGTVKCWGKNFSGEVGDGTNVDKSRPVAVAGISDAFAISVGTGHACALIVGGAVKCWGSNGYGQLGDGTSQDRSRPVSVVTLR
jgi:alpha-tubulin suppressor-like RCC1 family protein